jgi:uncharacterized membrane protein/mono/diheme cytochrome c family protein
LVHLPIGFLLIGIFFSFLGTKEKYQSLNGAVYYSLLLGAIAAILSCITGFLLSQNGEYDDGIVSKHQWLGIALTVVSFLALHVVKQKKPFAKYIMMVMGLLIVITGHLGGTLTHGEGYLTKGFSENTKQVTTKPVADVQQAVVYTDIIQPILQSKCYGCHGAAKQKGKLRLDEPAFIQKGGESGNTIVAGNANGSELIERILLAENDDDHMPPISKPQLTKNEIALLHWWIQQGADFTKKTMAMQQPETIKPYLLALQNGTPVTPTADEDGFVPKQPIAAAPDSVLQQLQALDISVTAVAKGSNYLSVSFAAVDSITNEQMQLLQIVSGQIVWLKMSGVKLNRDILKQIGQLKSLARLSLDNTLLNDDQLQYLSNLGQLQYLNLSSTLITEAGVGKLSSLKNLKQLYLYNTKTTAAGLQQLKQVFAKVDIDTGGYKLAFIPSDTMMAKPKNQKAK